MTEEKRILKEDLKGLELIEKIKLVANSRRPNLGTDKNVTEYIDVLEVKDKVGYTYAIIEIDYYKIFEDGAYHDNFKESIRYIIEEIDEIEDETFIARWEDEDYGVNTEEVFRSIEIVWREKGSSAAQVGYVVEKNYGYIVEEYEAVLRALESGQMKIEDIKDSRPRDGFTLNHFSSVARSWYQRVLPETQMIDFDEVIKNVWLRMLNKIAEKYGISLGKTNLEEMRRQVSSPEGIIEFEINGVELVFTFNVRYDSWEFYAKDYQEGLWLNDIKAEEFDIAAAVSEIGKLINISVETISE